MGLFVTIMALTMATGVFAQSFVVKGGFNLSEMLYKSDNGETYSDDFDMRSGYNFGATAEFPITGAFSFETGLLINTKGFRMREEIDFLGGIMEFDVRMNLLYLDIPLAAKASFDLGSAKIYGLFGPYVGLGLRGKVKSDITSGGETETENVDIDWGSDNIDDFKRLDYGLTMGAGIARKSIQLGLNYNWGLANVSPNTDNSAVSVYHRVLGVTVGYIFGRK